MPHLEQSAKAARAYWAERRRNLSETDAAYRNCNSIQGRLVSILSTADVRMATYRDPVETLKILRDCAERELEKVYSTQRGAKR